MGEVCACSSASFFRPNVFTLQRFLALCLGVVMGRFLPLPGTAFSWGHGGAVSSVQVRDSPPPPPPCPLGPLSYQGSIATGHTYGGAEGA